MEEKLMEAVRVRQILYDTSHADYMRTKLKTEKWEEIAKEIGMKNGKGKALTKTKGDDDDDVEGKEYSDEDKIGRLTGTTAVVALLKGSKLYVANAGDSRCVLCANGEAIEMSFDHKPKNEPELSRIRKAGGVVNYEGRVNGGLNMSRAIGDFYNKRNKDLSDREQMITALPDVQTLTIEPGEDEFMILACDGIWNRMSSQEVVNFVRSRILEGRGKLSQICEELFNHCLAPEVMSLGDGAGCDNMTAIIVEFKSSSLKKPIEPDESDAHKKSKIEIIPQVSTET